MVMKGPVCLAVPAVVKETNIPQSTVHINCFIPPTVLSLLTDTIKQVWTDSQVWILSLHVLVSLSVCSVRSLYFPTPSLSSLNNLSLPGPLLSLIPRGHGTAVWQNEITTEVL